MDAMNSFASKQGYDIRFSISSADKASHWVMESILVYGVICTKLRYNVKYCALDAEKTTHATELMNVQNYVGVRYAQPLMNPAICMYGEHS